MPLSATEGRCRILAAPLAIAAFTIFVVFDEDFSAHYVTTAEARGAGALGRGWLPRAMPDSAYDIARAYGAASFCNCASTSVRRVEFQ